MHNYVYGIAEVNSMTGYDGITRNLVKIRSEKQSRSSEWMVGTLQIGGAGGVNLPASARVRCQVKVDRDQP